ncbi:adenosine deaminase [Rickettsiella endosymbiont of Miltochrista miniata]|uniref:adenosine deaminase family protein n=1 Tax=Rickettsiella endosymbiont of Miltochrista miniata TaxID=3066239 RepID=UPI00313E46EA
MIRICTFFLLLLSGSLCVAETDASHATAAYYHSILTQPKKLSVFLQAMPKGGDLHNHLGGVSMAENMLRYAKHDDLCVNAKSSVVQNDLSCPQQYSIAQIQKFPTLYNQTIDAWSMRHFRPGKESGHDHFFATFEKYLPILMKHRAEMLNEAVERACRENLLYLELMIMPDDDKSGLLGSKLEWDDNLSRLREKLLKTGVIPIVLDISKQFDSYQKHMQGFLTGPGKQLCPNFTLRYLYQVLREQPPAQVFAQLLTGFELASRDPRVVGINLVQAEDGKISMRDYSLQMRMLGFLHYLYPRVKISLHAGELVPGLVPQCGLRFHIREAVEIAHANRIGHGVDIRHEDHAAQLMQEMAKKRILVEINLSSNAAILNVKGRQHPILLYRQHHVPVALSTDDEGVLRTNLTEQFKLAVLNYHFTYSTLKQLARNSIQYSFLPGVSLWQDANYQHPVLSCRDSLRTGKLFSTCQRFLASSEKANTQWKLEQQFLKFEQTFMKPHCY